MTQRPPSRADSDGEPEAAEEHFGKFLELQVLERAAPPADEAHVASHNGRPELGLPIRCRIQLDPHFGKV